MDENLLKRTVNNITSSSQTQPSTQPTPSNGIGSSEPDVWQGLDLTWHPDLRQAVKAIVRWHNDPSPAYPALLLAGRTGSGKTSLVRIVYNSIRAYGDGIEIDSPILVADRSSDVSRLVYSKRFFSEPKLLDDIRASFKKQGGGALEIQRSCQNCLLLVIDDLGAGSVKDESLAWYQGILWNILDDRAMYRRKTLITTNLRPTELEPRIGKRNYSRLQEMLGHRLNYVNMFAVPDYRAREW